MTLTDLATGWTECIPLLKKSADAVQAALAQAHSLFPFPLLGIDTDGGSEFLNEQVIMYCEQEHLTFTRGRWGVKNDQAHVEQKNRVVVREAVGYVRLVGVRAYQQLGEVYRARRLVVNCFQPSFKLQAKVLQGERVRRVYDVAQTPLQRALASGILSEERQSDMREQVQQIDPLALSEQLDALRYALLCEAHLPPTMGVFASAQIPLRFCLAACTPGARPTSEGACEQTCSHDVHASREEILAPLRAYPEWTSSQIVQEIEHRVPARAIAESSFAEEAVSDADPCAMQAPPFPARSFGTASRTFGEPEGGDGFMTVEQAIAAYLQKMRPSRSPKTLEWHHTSLRALRRYLWRQYHLTDIRHLSRDCLQTWVADLHLVPSARTGAARTVSTVSAYARSAKAFCNWLVRQGYVSEAFFPHNAIPDTPQGSLHVVEPGRFVHLLRACQLQGAPGGHRAGLTARNRAILWLLWDTGLQVSELCGLRLADVDRVSGTVTVQEKRGNLRTFPLSADGKSALDAYLDQARLTPAWEPAVPEAQNHLLLTERRRPLTKSSLTSLFQRLSLRAGFTRTSICPSMLRDTYALRFLQAGGTLAALQQQLGIAEWVSVKRYQHFCEQRRQEREIQACSEESVVTRQPRRGKSTRRKEQGRGRGRRRSS